MAERDAAGLPYTDKDHIQLLQQEYESAAVHGGREAVEKCFNLTWALVHSYQKHDASRGLELISALLTSDAAETRELLYLRAVAQFRLRHYLDSRNTLKSLLEQYPDFRQAQALLDAVEHEVVKDGLIGVGAGAAIIGIVASIAVAAMKKR
ncbi:hypothetical protein Ndes2526B_g09233 [Nannochloris sp. 'desiccata']|nr:hypothetical protein KSW81_003735 [Chlorella desiccata (nom. nud.)]KAH7615915.1 putative Mitochondrial fission 1 protein A [Chlorella desiccata (nom. nud.)]